MHPQIGDGREIYHCYVRESWVIIIMHHQIGDGREIYRYVRESWVIIIMHPQIGDGREIYHCFVAHDRYYY